MEKKCKNCSHYCARFNDGPNHGMCFHPQISQGRSCSEDMSCDLFDERKTQFAPLPAINREAGLDACKPETKKELKIRINTQTKEEVIGAGDIIRVSFPYACKVVEVMQDGTLRVSPITNNPGLYEILFKPNEYRFELDYKAMYSAEHPSNESFKS